MDKARILYTKTDKAKHISHLDLMTVFMRSLRRAGVKLKYTEGFNPHPYIAVALPMPVGAESICELLDTELDVSSIPRNINDYLPAGLEIQKIYRPLSKFTLIKWVEIECKLYYDSDDILVSEAQSQLNKRLSSESIIITKKTKRGSSDISISPHIRDAKTSITGDNSILLKAKISAQNPTVSYSDIISMVSGDTALNSFIAVDLKRIEIYNASMVVYK